VAIAAGRKCVGALAAWLDAGYGFAMRMAPIFASRLH
jgi:hypothetical protein